MQPLSPEIGSPRDWLRYAKSDLVIAQSARLLPEVLFDSFCFHAQQAAEKSMKAVLVQAGIRFPFTHNLETLTNLIKTAGIDWDETLNPVIELSIYALAGRYPSVSEAITEEEYDQAVALAEQVFTWAQSLIETLSEESP
ncbi:HEPN domain-containing protein [Myxacorys almedinensis]|uniref:HEPN domain-containing protein n=1 Tax=Myxacorys almedinensis A TaxID=2690445 RepID=A0A8J8CNE6_9CYAN|nr:HEPN domain-containing protein [Myxacorys almedinensis]NDJ18347.1 HEPN domain-containing protein [Myxacorys almedinensis A]